MSEDTCSTCQGPLESMASHSDWRVCRRCPQIWSMNAQGQWTVKETMGRLRNTGPLTREQVSDFNRLRGIPRMWALRKWVERIGAKAVRNIPALTRAGSE